MEIENQDLKDRRDNARKRTQIAILVSSKVAAILLCKSTTNLTLQECKLETSLQHVNFSFEVTTRQICHKFVTSNSLQTIAKTEYEHNLGLEFATYAP
ncbi:hypothetical protein AVEN_130759-1 [Araneus ventricosus]|uniref:Uncharacterized protein n=1 Tax=Araneus ventricosus TaxID=182803 RepID=A0A4Y2GHN6_ARAVE|nr:hypothetical protein AVEN_130759-1 [Araneus ventricosus]